ncbi:MAG: DUF4129 domain-containing protein [Leptolyngbya sp. SIO1E4]|nr:DUF4129 domain-containing protein [Leptolyngbya sp. SIO1E4]
MTAESIQTSSLAWQIRHLAKNLSEWIRLQLVFPDVPDLPSWEYPPWIGRFLLGLAVIGGVLWLAWVLVQLVDRYLMNRAQLPQSQLHVQTVHPPPARTAADWMRQAQRFEQQRNWQEACRAIYLAALQLLHERDWISHQFSRTDGEYLQAIQTLKQPRPLQLLIRTHERSHFGAAPLTAENLHRCRQAYQEIENR